MVYTHFDRVCDTESSYYVRLKNEKGFWLTMDPNKRIRNIILYPYIQYCIVCEFDWLWYSWVASYTCSFPNTNWNDERKCIHDIYHNPRWYDGFSFSFIITYYIWFKIHWYTYLDIDSGPTLYCPNRDCVLYACTILLCILDVVSIDWILSSFCCLLLWVVIWHECMRNAMSIQNMNNRMLFLSI